MLTGMMLLYREIEDSDNSIIKAYLIGILLLIIFFYIIVYFLKTYKKGILIKRGRHLKIIDTLPLSKDSVLYIVKANEEYLLIGSSNNGLRLIKGLDSVAFTEIEDIEDTKGLSFKDSISKCFSKNKDGGTK